MAVGGRLARAVRPADVRRAGAHRSAGRGRRGRAAAVRGALAPDAVLTEGGGDTPGAGPEAGLPLGAVILGVPVRTTHGVRLVRIDLHTHSTASDGTDTPAELVRNAAARRAGRRRADRPRHRPRPRRGDRGAARRADPGHRRRAVLPAGRRRPAHAGLPLRSPRSPSCARERELVRDDRVPRAQAMVAKLQELGVPVTWEQVARIAGDGSVGRPHIATALVELGVVPTVSDAFTPEWLADGGRAYVEKHELDPFEAIRLVKAAGGVTVFAHPAAVKRGRVRAGVRDRRAGRRRPRRHRGRPHGPRRADPRPAARPGRRARAAGHRLQRLPRQPQDLSASASAPPTPEIYGEIASGPPAPSRCRAAVPEHHVAGADR